MSKKKKIIVLCSMVLLLAVTVAFNFLLSNAKNIDDKDTITTGNYFVQHRDNRMTTRNKELLYLDAIINSATEAQDVKANALNQKLLIVKNMEMELLLESIMKAKGFEEVVVTIGLDSEIVNVIVKDKELTMEDSAKIYNICKTEAKRTPEFVKIIPIS